MAARAVGRRHKYGARPTTVDGIRFASQKEAGRYRELRLLEKAGEIMALELQPSFDLTVRGVRIARYVADFQYYRPDGELVTEDVKGVRTPVYRLKKKHVEAQYGIRVVEV